jgi:xylan 1,4-beta-xylosidase
MPSGPSGPDKVFDVEIKNVSPLASVELWRVDDNHSNVLKAFDAMGRPAGDLTQEQIKQLRAAGAMSAPEHLHLRNGKLHVTVPAHGLALVVVGKK